MAKKYKVAIGGLYSVSTNAGGALDWVHPFGCGNMNIATTANEIRMRTHYSYAGKFKNFRLFFSNRVLPIDMTWTVWKNGVSTGVSVVVPAGSGGGFFENNVDEIDVAVGDYFQWRMSAPSTSPAKIYTLDFIGCDYETKECVTRYTTASNSAAALAVTAAPTYMNFTTAKAITTTLTDNFRLVVPADGYIRLCIYITNNIRTTPAEMYLNINGVRSTGVFLTIPNGITGFFVSDPIAVTQGDIIAADMDLSGGTGSLNYVENGLFYYNDIKTYMAVSSGLTVLGNTTQRFYSGMGFSGGNATSFTQRIFRLKGTGKVRKLYQLVYSNTATTNGTVRIVQGGSNTAIEATIPSATNTVISDLVNEVSYINNDNFCLGTVRSGSVNTSSGVTSFEIVPDGISDFIPQAIWFD